VAPLGHPILHDDARAYLFLRRSPTRSQKKDRPSAITLEQASLPANCMSTQQAGKDARAPK
jgi:hypothetical protein